ncbi:TPA: DUF3265 domain-containing protein [Vibrio vulnificus]|nr:DUF3265 domain-containing protein [Vibrio vulnificus]HDY8220438.1 DUF3265 domain-containing protein [Vibrio vulnificus]
MFGLHTFYSLKGPKVRLQKHVHNKALKRDSCRVAFLHAVGFGSESGLRKVSLCGIHPLTQRYTNSS